jgi:uncharacterized membrane protein
VKIFSYIIIFLLKRFSLPHNDAVINPPKVTIVFGSKGNIALTTLKKKTVSSNVD